MPDERHDVARLGRLDLDALRAFEAEDGADAHVRGALLADQSDGLVDRDLAAVDAADGEATDVLVVLDVVHQDLQRAVLVDLRRAHALHDGLEQGLEVGRGIGQLALGHALLADGVDGGKFRLLVAGFELAEQVEHLVQHVVRARVLAVDLVDHDDDRHAELERFREHEARLRQRAFGRVDQEQHAVGHLQRALDLAAEVGVAGRVDDVDRVVFVFDAAVLRENRDAALALEIVRVHHAIGHGLVVTEDAGLTQHGVDQSGLAVIDVGDDGDVSKLLSGHWRRIASPELPATQGGLPIQPAAEAVIGGSYPRPAEVNSAGPHLRVLGPRPENVCGFAQAVSQRRIPR